MNATSRPLVLVLVLLLSGCDVAFSNGDQTTTASMGTMDNPPRTPRGPEESDSDESSMNDVEKVTVRVFDESGNLSDPVAIPKVVKSDDEWKKVLTPEQFKVIRSAGTERPFCGALLDNKEEGVYTCAACGLPLFSSDSKFKSGTGWPSFFQPIADENVAQRMDYSHGMTRVEINCARCDGHLGHVFEDGPRPTGLRFCLNSESLQFTPSDKLATLADPALKQLGDSIASATRAKAVFAGGCFWCVEAVFEELEGVEEVLSGYAGGSEETANYKAVCTGRTGHAEAVEIIYDPSKISYEELLRVHFATHDPTTLNRQGNDVGPQYRSAIFYANDQEKALAQAFIDDLAEQRVFGDKPIVTTLEPLEEFYEAEQYHQNYVCNNPMQPYIRSIALPKVEKVRKAFKDKLKEVSPLDRE